MADQQDTLQRLLDAGWDDDNAREAAAIEHGDHGCIPDNGGKGDDQPRPRRRVRRRTHTE